jgi:hypothetical protein
MPRLSLVDKAHAIGQLQAGVHRQEWSCANIWCSPKYHITVEMKVPWNRRCKRQANEWSSQNNNSWWRSLHPPDWHCVTYGCHPGLSRPD